MTNIEAQKANPCQNQIQSEIWRNLKIDTIIHIDSSQLGS